MKFTHDAFPPVLAERVWAEREDAILLHDSNYFRDRWKMNHGRLIE